MRHKTHDIQWPVGPKTIENINTNFDTVFDALTDFEQRMASSLSISGSAHQILSFSHSDTLTANRLRGDILYVNATPRWARLAKGVSGYVLTAGALDVAWASPAHNLLSATHSDTTAAACVRGDVIIGDSTPKWIRLAKGTATYVLTAGASDVSWANPAHNLLSTTHGDTLADTVVRGDVLIGNATPKWTRLPAGTATYVLTMGASDPAWAAPVVQTSALLSATHTDTIPSAVARGDVIIGSTATPKWTALTKGTAGFVLTMGAEEPAWAAPATPAAHVLDGALHTVSGLTTGHFLKATGATTFAFAAHGLTYGDVGAAPLAHVHAWGDITSGVPTTWTPIAHNLLSAYHGDTTASAVARGDMIIGSTATPKWTALTKGTSGYVLTMGAEEPGWATPAAPAAHVLDGALHTVSGLTSGHFLKATGAATFGFAAHGLGYGDVGAAPLSHVHAWGDITSGVPTTWTPIAHDLLSVYHGDTLADSVVRGDVLIGNATPKWARLAKGTAGYVLTMGADDPAWAALPAAAAHDLLSVIHSDTLAHPAVRGDLIVADGSTPCLWAPFEIGAVGSVLYSDGTDPSWKLISSIATTSLSDTANLAYLNASNTFTAVQQITVAGSTWLWLKATTNNVVQLALERNEPAGSYNITWNAYIPASSKDFRIQGGGSDWLVITAAGAVTVNGVSITTPAESWIGPSSTAGVYFKSGNVGIGTTAPTEKLSVDNHLSAAFFAFGLLSDTAGRGATFGTSDYVGGSSGTRLRFAFGAGTGNTYSIIDSQYLGNSAGVLVINPTGGNVGIGTVAPPNLLSLGASGNFSFAPNGTAARYLLIDPGSTTYAGSMIIQAGAGSGAWGGAVNLFGHAHATKPGWVQVGISAGSGGYFTINDNGLGTGTDVFKVQGATGDTELRALKVTGLGAFAAGDKYVITDASGNLKISATGPAS